MNARWNNQKNPFMSVVMLGYRRADLLDRAVESFCANAVHTNWELILVLNGPSESVRQAAQRWEDANSFPVHVLECASLRPGAARNLGVRAARGEVLLFLDDDIECFQDLTAPIHELFFDKSLVAAGGPNLTPPGSGAWERAFGYAMASYFGAGKMSQRYRNGEQKNAGETDLILCNLAIRREVFLQQGGFGFGFISNEENILLQRLQEKNAYLLFSPKLAVFHRRRKLPALWQQVKKYGSGRAQNILALPQTFELKFLFPAFFLIYSALLPFLALRFGAESLIPLMVYMCFALAFSWGAQLYTGDRPACRRIPLIYPLIHAAYAWGFLVTLFSPRKFSLEDVSNEPVHAAQMD